MKQIELELKKRLLIVECECIQEAYEKNTNHYDIKLICKGSELWKHISNKLVHKSLHTGLFAHYVKDIPVNTYCYRSSLISFISAIEAHGFCWGFNDTLYEYRNIPNSPSFKKAESKTFHLEKTLIFEIV